MIILGIESSCDETGIGIIDVDPGKGLRVLSNQIASQIKLHAPFGGVVPEIASRAHLGAIGPLTDAALKEAGLDLEQVDAIAVTQGPGLIGALLVGAAYAKALALSLAKPLIPVDHVEAHVHGALLGLENQGYASYQDLMESTFPALSLVVSGGHTNLYAMKTPIDFRLLGYSVDDACGECFDKVGKLLHFAYPAGPIIEQRALGGNPKAWPMPQMLPMRPSGVSQRPLGPESSGQSSNREPPILFSYSGLKTFLAQTIAKISPPGTSLPKDPSQTLPDHLVSDLCSSFQEEALGQIVRKTKEALHRHPETRSILVAGGVAANERFRTLLRGEVDVDCIFPPLKACSDNGAMIAAYAYHRWFAWQNHRSQEGIDHVSHGDPFSDHHWECYSRYRFSSMDPIVT